MKYAFGLLFWIFFAACGMDNQKAVVLDNPSVSLQKTINSTTFNQSFEEVLNNYFLLTNQFMEEKADSLINHQAFSLMKLVDSFPLSSLKADSNLVNTAKSYFDGMSAELKGLIGEKELEAKRKELQIISDQLYDLIRTVQYDRAVIYHIYSPKAFNSQGAYWLSNTTNLANPYIPKKIPQEGEIKDSINFSQL